MAKALPVVEIFDSIQGEGPRLHPAIFLRTALCCFKCKGFGCHLTAPDGTDVIGCDTIRAVSTKFKDTWSYFDNSKDLIEKLNSHVQVYKSERLKQDLIVTGGEPLLHWDNLVFQETLEAFALKSHHITVETNAAFDIKFTKPFQNQISFSMSVKLHNCGEKKEKRINLRAINNLISNSKDSYFKFVVNPKTWSEDEKEIDEILEAVEYKAPVYLMPLGGNKQELNDNTLFVVEKCIEKGFRYTDRTHIRAWNTKEGV